MDQSRLQADPCPCCSSQFPTRVPMEFPSPKPHPATLHNLIFSWMVFQPLRAQAAGISGSEISPPVPRPQPGGGAAVINSGFLNYLPELLNCFLLPNCCRTMRAINGGEREREGNRGKQEQKDRGGKRGGKEGGKRGRRTGEKTGKKIGRKTGKQDLGRKTGKKTGRKPGRKTGRQDRGGKQRGK